MRKWNVDPHEKKYLQKYFAASYARVCVCVCVCVNTCLSMLPFFLSYNIQQGDAGDFHGRHPTKTPWISCDMNQGRLTHVPAMHVETFEQAVHCGVLQ